LVSLGKHASGDRFALII